jgi:hypothetical protein
MLVWRTAVGRRKVRCQPEEEGRLRLCFGISQLPVGWASTKSHCCGLGKSLLRTTAEAELVRSPSLQCPQARTLHQWAWEVCGCHG